MYAETCVFTFMHRTIRRPGSSNSHIDKLDRDVIIIYWVHGVFYPASIFEMLLALIERLILILWVNPSSVHPRV